MTIKDYLGKKVVYSKEIAVIHSLGVGGEFVKIVRGSRALRINEDELSQFIADAINEKLERESRNGIENAG